MIRKFESSVKCDKCGNKLYGGFIYKLEDGKKFCNECLIKEGIIWKLKNFNGGDSTVHFKEILTEDEYKRFIKNERE